MNPYNWNHHDLAVEIPRPEVHPVVESLRRGKSGVLIAGRGLGKTTFLRQIQRELEKLPEVHVVVFRVPPAEPTVHACLEQLARQLEVPIVAGAHAHDLVGAYRKRDVPASLVLLFDELDRYARPPVGPHEVSAGRDYFNSLESMRRDFPRVGIFAAGSVGVFTFRDALGSSFLAGADSVRIQPFSREDLDLLARPFAEQGKALSRETLDALHLASGGNPALATYGFESLWPHPEPSENAVTEAFADFQDKNHTFLQAFARSFSDPKLSDAPRRVWDLIQRSDGTLSGVDLQQACSSADQLLSLDVEDVLDLLAASGLVKLSTSLRADPIILRPINSILSLPTSSATAPELGEQLRLDLQTLLGWLHVSSPDFFRPGSKRENKQIVPESVFAGTLTLGLRGLGWQAEREAQRGAGRTDIQLRRSTTGEVAIVEIKIWGRHGYQTTHHQLESYWTADTGAGAVVMLTDAEIDNWPERYQQECLADCESIRAIDQDSSSPIRAQIAVSSRTSDGMSVEATHFLLRLPRGR